MVLTDLLAEYEDMTDEEISAALEERRKCRKLKVERQRKEPTGKSKKSTVNAKKQEVKVKIAMEVLEDIF